MPPRPSTPPTEVSPDGPTRRSLTPRERTQTGETRVGGTLNVASDPISFPAYRWHWPSSTEDNYYRPTPKLKATVAQVPSELEIREAKRRLQSVIPKQKRSKSRDFGDAARRVIIITYTLPYILERVNEEYTLTYPLQRPPQDLLKGQEVWTVGIPTIRSADGAVSFCEFSDDLVQFLVNSGKNLIPVFPDADPGGIALQEIFQLFNYTTPQLDSGFRTTVEDWKEFERLNSKFAATVKTILVDNDLVWILDYHLMLLPRLLRKTFLTLPIAFSFRCVFPSSELYRILPRREDLLRGVLSSNLITFHNFQYTRHFQTACTRLLGIECSVSGIEAHPEEDTTGTKLSAIPMGIDPYPYSECMTTEETQLAIAKLRKTFGERKVILGIDLLEERKGIPHKLLAFNKFLTRNPEWAEKCVFLQVVVSGDEPSSSQDQEARSSQLLVIHRMAGEINSRFGTFGLVPIHFLDKRLTPQELIPAFAVACIALCTSLRDVLSMTAFEYLACNGCQRKDNSDEPWTPGVLILSEFTGTAQSLRAAALFVNPWNTVEFADAIAEAFVMSQEEVATRMTYGYNHVMKYTQQRWVNDVMEEIDEILSDESTITALRVPPRLDHAQVIDTFREAGRRLLVLGFSGTLMPRDRYFNPNVIASSRLPDVTLANLESLAADENTDVIVVSSVSRVLLEHALAGIPCWIIAEGGVSFRAADTEEWQGTADHVDTSWMDSVEEVFQYFGDRTPGAFIHKTSCTIAWHFRSGGIGLSGDYGSIQSKELLIHLWSGPLLNAPAETVVGANSVEVRPVDVSKANQLEHILTDQIPWNREGEDGGYDMVFCAGDFVVRDEDIFQTIRKCVRRRGFFPTDDTKGFDGDHTGHFTATVGRKKSHAMYHLVDYEEVEFLLAKLAWARQTARPRTLVSESEKRDVWETQSVCSDRHRSST